MKIIAFICILTCCMFSFSGCGKTSDNTENSNNTGNSNNTEFSRLSTSSSNNTNTSQTTEVNLSNFSTPLKSGGKNRITNIKITCGKINGYLLKNGETFSFNQVIGPCKAEEGYLKAEIFVNKKIKYALGGGNCQVSTTLYNACIQVPGITIVERHEHNGRSVDYIEDGKDATVSYNTLDLSFRNDTGKDIKLYTSCDDVNVYASINSLD